MNIQSEFDLQNYNTFGLRSQARFFSEIVTEQDLQDALNHELFGQIRHLWLGGGSNIIVSPYVDAWVLHVNNKGIEIISESDETVLIEAQAGENWHELVLHCLDLGYSGLENLSLIPGQVGSAPVQNIGAYGVEVKDIIHSVTCFDVQNQTWQTLSNSDCEFAYRNSFFKKAEHGRYVIWSVTLELNKSFKPNINYGDLVQVTEKIAGNDELTAKMVSQAVCEIRQSKLPNPEIMGNVGSFFHNPIIAKHEAQALKAQYPNMPQYTQDEDCVKIAAGWMIDQAGLKGLQQGGAAVHQKQALVLVNQSGATHQDVLDLSHKIQNMVKLKFGVFLHVEPTFW